MKCTTRYAIVKKENSEGMISKVSLIDLINETITYNKAWLLSAVALFLFVIIYGVTKHVATKRLNNQYDRISESLSLYLEAFSTIKSNSNYLELEQNNLWIALHKCRTAPHIKSNLQGQIELYLQEPTPTRLTMVTEELGDELETLRKKRRELLQQIESPSFGCLLWQTFSPVIPFIFAVLLYYDLYAFIQLIAHSNWSELHYEDIEKWSSWLGLNIAIITAYPLCTLRFKKARNVLLALAITAMGAVGGFILLVAPYLVVLQLLLIVVGLSMTEDKSRRKRPFAGMTQVREIAENSKPSQDRALHQPPSSNNSEQE